MRISRVFPGWNVVVGLAAAVMICAVAVFGQAVRPEPAAGQTDAAPPADGAALTTPQTLSYALGVTVGRQLAKQSIDVAMFVRGFEDARGGGRLLLTDAQVRAAVAKLQSAAARRVAAARAERAAAPGATAARPSSVR